MKDLEERRGERRGRPRQRLRLPLLRRVSCSHVRTNPAQADDTGWGGSVLEMWEEASLLLFRSTKKLPVLFSVLVYFEEETRYEKKLFSHPMKGSDHPSHRVRVSECEGGSQDHPSPDAAEGTDISPMTTSAFTIREYFARRMAERKSKAQGTAVGPEASETPVERKAGKKRKKEAKDKNVENCTHPKAKKKGDQVEWQLGDPRWDENSGAASEDGEGCTLSPPYLFPFMNTIKEMFQHRLPERSQPLHQPAAPYLDLSKNFPTVTLFVFRVLQPLQFGACCAGL
eukprot:bmy_09206T0